MLTKGSEERDTLPFVGTAADERRDFLFDYLKDAPDRLIADASDLDNKMVGIFSAASVVLGLASIGNLGVVSVSGSVRALLICAAAFYLGSAVIALIHFKPVEFGRALHAESMWSRAVANDISVREIKQFVLDSVESEYAANKRVIKRKGRTLFWAVVTVGLEVVCVSGAVIAARF